MNSALPFLNSSQLNKKMFDTFLKVQFGIMFSPINLSYSSSTVFFSPGISSLRNELSPVQCLCLLHYEENSTRDVTVYLIQTVYRPAWNKIVLFLSAFMAEQNPQAALLTYWTYSDNTSLIFWQYLIMIHSIALNLRQDSNTQINNVIIKWICISEMVWHHQDVMGDAVTFQCVVSSWSLASSSRMSQENSGEDR